MGAETRSALDAGWVGGMAGEDDEEQAEGARIRERWVRAAFRQNHVPVCFALSLGVGTAVLAGACLAAQDDSGRAHELASVGLAFGASGFALAVGALLAPVAVRIVSAPGWLGRVAPAASGGPARSYDEGSSGLLVVAGPPAQGRPAEPKAGGANAAEEEGEATERALNVPGWVIRATPYATAGAAAAASAMLCTWALLLNQTSSGAVYTSVFLLGSIAWVLQSQFLSTISAWMRFSMVLLVTALMPSAFALASVLWRGSAAADSQAGSYAPMDAPVLAVMMLVAWAFGSSMVRTMGQRRQVDLALELRVRSQATMSAAIVSAMLPRPVMRDLQASKLAGRPALSSSPPSLPSPASHPQNIFSCARALANAGA